MGWCLCTTALPHHPGEAKHLQTAQYGHSDKLCSTVTWSFEMSITANTAILGPENLGYQSKKQQGITVWQKPFTRITITDDLQKIKTRMLQLMR